MSGEQRLHKATGFGLMSVDTFAWPPGCSSRSRHDGQFSVGFWTESTTSTSIRVRRDSSFTPSCFSNARSSEGCLGSSATPIDSEGIREVNVSSPWAATLSRSPAHPPGHDRTQA